MAEGSKNGKEGRRQEWEGMKKAGMGRDEEGRKGMG